MFPNCCPIYERPCGCRKDESAFRDVLRRLSASTAMLPSEIFVRAVRVLPSHSVKRPPTSCSERGTDNDLSLQLMSSQRKATISPKRMPA
jgi:hypothetical protein